MKTEKISPHEFHAGMPIIDTVLGTVKRVGFAMDSTRYEGITVKGNLLEDLGYKDLGGGDEFVKRLGVHGLSLWVSMMDGGWNIHIGVDNAANPGSLGYTFLLAEGVKTLGRIAMLETAITGEDVWARVFS